MKNEVRSFFKDVGNWLSLFVGITTAVITILFFFTSDNSAREDYETLVRKWETDSLRIKLQKIEFGRRILEDSIISLKIELESQSKNHSKGKNESLITELQFRRFSGRVDSISSRLTALEDALVENPAKALSIPLIRKDIDNLKESEQKDIDTLKGQMATIYDQNKWFIGLMFTLAIGMISLAVGNFIPKKSKDKDEKEVKSASEEKKL